MLDLANLREVTPSLPPTTASGPIKNISNVSIMRPNETANYLKLLLQQLDYEVIWDKAGSECAQVVFPHTEYSIQYSISPDDLDGLEWPFGN